MLKTVGEQGLEANETPRLDTSTEASQRPQSQRILPLLPALTRLDHRNFERAAVATSVEWSMRHTVRLRLMP
jgi:hypothetical protein